MLSVAEYEYAVGLGAYDAVVGVDPRNDRIPAQLSVEDQCAWFDAYLEGYQA